jgi:hypothetical protein
MEVSYGSRETDESMSQKRVIACGVVARVYSPHHHTTFHIDNDNV